MSAITDSATAAQTIVNTRWPLFCAWMERWLSSVEGWQADMLQPERLQKLRPLLETFRRSVLAQDATLSYTSRITALTRWWNDFLLPLAEALGVRSAVERQLIEYCWRHGWFDKLMHSKKAQPLTLEEVIHYVESLLHAHMDDNSLLVNSLCVDEENVQRVLRQFNRIDERTTDAVWEVIVNTIAYGPWALVTHANYPCADELVRIERYADVIAHLSNQPESILAAVRADVLALYDILHEMDVVAQQKFERQLLLEKQKKRKNRAYLERPRLRWRSDLLHQPRYSLERQAYRELLSDKERPDIIASLAVARNYSQTDAAAVFDIFVGRGLPGLFCWHMGMVEQTPDPVLVKRHELALNKHVSCLEVRFITQIQRLLKCLQAAIENLELPISLFPLVDEYPGTPARRTFKTWLRSNSQFVQEFRRLASLNETDASSRLFSFGTYGGIGLLRFGSRKAEEEQLIKIVESELGHFIHFHKLAHPEERIGLMELYQRVNVYADSLGSPHISPQIVQALFNRLPKPPYWNNGQSSDTAPFHRRSSLSIRKLPQLHSGWVFVPLRLLVEVINASFAVISDNCYITLVLDHDSGLPIGCWVSLQKPGAPELGLALYQAIWHVGRVHYPLRAVPKTVAVPPSLGLTSADLEDLHRAAFFLDTNIEHDSRERHWQQQRLATTLQDTAPSIIDRYTSRPYATLQQIQNAVLAWLHDTRLNTQNIPPVLTSWWNPGYAMPGYNSPAAGWLLPEAKDQVVSVQHGVLHGEVLYRDAHSHLEPGQLMSYRTFPYEYAATERGIFVMWNGNPYYLTPSSKKYPI